MNHHLQGFSPWPLAAATVLAATLTGAAIAAPQAALAHDTHAQQAMLGIGQSQKIRTFSDKCFTVANGDSGDSVPIRTYTCGGNDPAQQFTLAPVGNNEYEIKTSWNKCLTVANRDSGDSVPIRTYTCGNDAPQRFRLVPAENGQYEIKTFSDKCLTVADQNTGNNADIRTYTCRGDFAQRFRFDPGL
ncbi:RICIN domain-containing protein [Nonomuraea sp. NPDC003560]|uniref:RICIN domain-containing protein n=1 Tax=Nonomuraea sp. NPDC003560 TaxID=3364341 RepID=UPI0036C6C125